jgi:hypothetical protein
MAEILKRNGWAIEKSKISYHLEKGFQKQDFCF